MSWVIKTEGLTKNYGWFLWKRKTPALDCLNIEIQSGSVFGFLGPNGAGKTTTIKLVMGLIKPTAGKAFALGVEADDIEVKNRIGFLPDNPAFSSQLTAYEFLNICAKLLRIPSNTRRARINEVLEIVKMTKHAKSKLGTFSRGMTQRIGIAQAILNRPELLILDEPLLGLDPYGRQELKDIILEQKRNKTTVFFSSHILSDVEEICDSFAILNNGKLLCCGGLNELLASDGCLVRISNCDEAVKELMGDATETLKKSQHEWELIFKNTSRQTDDKIKAAAAKYSGKLQISASKEHLQDFFFRKIAESEEKK